jgi:hypothetical protein
MVIGYARELLTTMYLLRTMFFATRRCANGAMDEDTVREDTRRRPVQG